MFVVRWASKAAMGLRLAEAEDRGCLEGEPYMVRLQIPETQFRRLVFEDCPGHQHPLRAIGVFQDEARVSIGE